MRFEILPLLALAASVANAWGGVGHRTVGYLAEEYLTSEAKSLFGTLLKNDNGYDYSDAAVWADAVKSSMPWSAPLHYINPKLDDPPRNKCVVDYPSDCPKEGCILSAIRNYTSIVLNVTNTLIERKNASMFLIHLIGDLHQPLHVSGYKRGGNDVKPVCWNRIPAAGCAGGPSLHAVWDTNIPHKSRGLPQSLDTASEKKASKQWAKDLFSRQKTISLDTTKECSDIRSNQCILKWAVESNKLVCSHVLRLGEDWILHNNLVEGYFEENWEIVDEMIGKAGLRLAAWMNAIAKVTSKGADVTSVDEL